MLTEMRKKGRQTFERRAKDRRQVSFEFNSPEWIVHIKKNYAAWPKIDRRVDARRDGERRHDTLNKQASLSVHTDYSSDLLTTEERLYFDELFMASKKQ